MITKKKSKVFAGEKATSSLRLLTKADAKLRYRVSVVVVVAAAAAAVVVAGNSISFATKLKTPKTHFRKGRKYTSRNLITKNVLKF